MRNRFLLFFIFVCFFVFSCGEKKKVLPEKQEVSKAIFERIEILDNSHKVILTIQPETREIIKLVDEKNKNAGKISIRENKLKLYDESDKLVWIIKKKEDKYKILNVYEQEVFSIKRKEGGFRVKDKNGKIIAKIKPKNSKFKVSDEIGNLFGKVDKKGDEIKIKDSKGNTLYRIRENINTEYAGFLLLPDLSLIQKSSILVAFLVFEKG
jgi:hypothetical protein